MVNTSAIISEKTPKFKMEYENDGFSKGTSFFNLAEFQVKHVKLLYEFSLDYFYGPFSKVGPKLIRASEGLPRKKFGKSHFFWLFGNPMFFSQFARKPTQCKIAPPFFWFSVEKKHSHSLAQSRKTRHSDCVGDSKSLTFHRRQRLQTWQKRAPKPQHR